MGRAPCGCDLDEAARRDPDPRGREVLLGDAARAQARWGCRFAVDPVSKQPLPGVTTDPGCVATLRGVEALVGAEEGEYQGCPCSTLRSDDTELALRAFRWWKAGQLTLRVGTPNAALVEAIDLIQSGLSQRETDDLRRLRERPPTPTDGTQ